MAMNQTQETHKDERSRFLSFWRRVDMEVYGNILFGRVSLEQKALFAKHLSVMLQSGLSLLDALAITEEAARGRFRRVLQGVIKSLVSGRSLSQAFARYPKVFSGIFISATQAGEASGTLDQNLAHVAEQLEQERELVGKIRVAMFYPMIVLVASTLLGVGIVIFVLPQVVPLFEGFNTQLPWTTRFLMALSAFMQVHGLLLVLVCVLGGIALWWAVQQSFAKPIVHAMYLRLPVLKYLVRNVNLARFCRNVGILLRSGLIIDDALEISSKSIGNFYYEHAVKDMAKRLGKGTSLSTNIAHFKALFPVMTVRMVRVGEETGRLDDSLLYLADFYEQEIDRSTKSLSNAIEPMLLIIIGCIVAFLAFAIVSPIYDITSNVSNGS